MCWLGGLSNTWTTHICVFDLCESGKQFWILFFFAFQWYFRPKPFRNGVCLKPDYPHNRFKSNVCVLTPLTFGSIEINNMPQNVSAYNKRNKTGRWVRETEKKRNGLNDIGEEFTQKILLVVLDGDLEWAFITLDLTLETTPLTLKWANIKLISLQYPTTTCIRMRGMFDAGAKRRNAWSMCT